MIEKSIHKSDATALDAFMYLSVLRSSRVRSDSTLCRRPDELVHLKLKTDVEPIGQNPFDDFPRIDPAKNRREQNGVTASGQIEPVNVLPRPFVIFARANHEFHFIARTEVIDVRPKVLFYFSAPRRLQIHDPVDSRINLRDIVRAAGLE